MTKARDLSKLLGTNTNGVIPSGNLDVDFENIVDTGTEGTKVALGTTAQRGSTQGQIRFNTTTGLAEYFDGTSFVNIEGTPIINSVSPTSINTGTNPLPQNITITGVNFQSGSTVTFIDNQGTETNSPSVTFTDATSLTAQLPSSVTIGNQPFDVRVNNPTGLTAILADAVQLDALPTWTTSAGNIGTIVDKGNQSVSVSASDPDGGAVSYSETGGTVLSTAGLSLNSSTGAITGDPNDLSTNSETKTFTLRATDNENNTADRTFNIIINKALDGSTTARAGFSAQDLLDASASSGSGKYININGTIVQMEYDSTDRFGTGVSGWLKFDNSFRNSYGGNLSPTAGSPTYVTGTWNNNYQEFILGNASNGDTNGTYIGYVQMNLPRLQYAHIETVTASGSGAQTPDDTASWDYSGNQTWNSYTVDYVANKSAQTPNPQGYPFAIWDDGISTDSYDTTNESVGSTGNIIYPNPGGVLGSYQGSQTWNRSNWSQVSFSSFNTSGNMKFVAFTGDSGQESYNFTNFEMWVH